jgi:hypothetical protein
MSRYTSKSVQSSVFDAIKAFYDGAEALAAEAREVVDSTPEGLRAAPYGSPMPAPLATRQWPRCESGVSRSGRNWRRARRIQRTRTRKILKSARWLWVLRCKMNARV